MYNLINQVLNLILFLILFFMLNNSRKQQENDYNYLMDRMDIMDGKDTK